jgi:uncharacterized protein (TIGR03084 family)
MGSDRAHRTGVDPAVEPAVEGVVELVGDLTAEQQALDDVVSNLSDEQWHLATPSPGWDVADQIGHLAYFDDAARLALEDPDGFGLQRVELLSTFADSAAMERATLGRFRSMSPSELLDSWRSGRSDLTRAAVAADPDIRVEWYGPSMSLRSFLTARLMEAWAHGQDVVDAVAVETGGTRPATERLRHVAQLGVITRAWSYRNRHLDVPDGEVRVELTSPSGNLWTWGPAEGADSVRGTAEDFCLVVTQRRHVDDTWLVTTGPLAREWMTLAQAFAGRATNPPSPGKTGTTSTKSTKST